MSGFNLILIKYKTYHPLICSIFLLGWRVCINIIYSSCSPSYLAALLKNKINNKKYLIHFYFSEINISLNQINLQYFSKQNKRLI